MLPEHSIAALFEIVDMYLPAVNTWTASMWSVS